MLALHRDIILFWHWGQKPFCKENK